MSRAYRIKVRETVSRVVRAEDSISSQLELLEILPAEQMAGLLAEELQSRGFQRQGNHLVRKQEGATITVEPETGTVTVQSEASQQVQVEGERHGLADSDKRDSQKKSEDILRKVLRKDLEKQADQRKAKLQTQVTQQLEAQLGELRQELDQAVNRVTAEALKRKAAQMGQIKEMTEDPESGNLTIVLEV